MTDPKEVMRIGEAAEFLATSKGTLYHWVSEGRVPVIRISKRCIRFRGSELEKGLAAMTAPQRNKESGGSIETQGMRGL